MEQVYNRPLYKVITIINNSMKDLLDGHTLVLHEVTIDLRMKCYRCLKAELHSINKDKSSDIIIITTSMNDRIIEESFNLDMARLTDMVESKMLEELLILVKNNFKNVQL